MGSPLKASIIIPSYNGARKIYNLLNGLLAQPFRDIEIIVVIDGSTDNTEDVLKPYQQGFSHFQIIRQNNGGRSVARNNGARAANSELLIFYDDDVVPFPDSPEKHFVFHRTNFGILCGDQFETSGKHNTDIQNYKAWLTAKWTGKYADGLTRMQKDRLFFTAANCSVPKDLFWQLNGFDQDLTDAEDYELACRAIEQRIPVYYDKKNKAFHDDKITCRSYIRRLREYSEAKKKIKDDFPKQLARKNMLTPVKKFIYRAFAFSFWVRLIDAGFFVFVFPKSLRYRLYSIIIHALANEHAR